jgi:curved DNA-binding protein CbpA
MEESSGGREPTFYETLGIGEDASAEEIREAYRERAKDTHPDLNDAVDARRRFRRVKRAHEVLGDADERRRYDRLGHETYRDRRAGGYASSSDRAGDGRNDEPSRGSGGRRRAGSGTARGRAAEGGTSGGSATSGGRETGGRTGGRGDGGGQRASGDGRRRDRPGGGTRADAGGTGEPRSWGTRARGAAGLVAYGLARWLRLAGVLFDAWQSRLGSAGAAIALASFASYPILLASTVTPLFPLGVNLLVGMCTVTLLGYLVVRPAVGVAVLGSWLLVLPIALTVSGIGVLSPAGLYSLVLTVVPFALCVSTLAGVSI